MLFRAKNRNKKPQKKIEQLYEKKIVSWLTLPLNNHQFVNL